LACAAALGWVGRVFRAFSVPGESDFGGASRISRCPRHGVAAPWPCAGTVPNSELGTVPAQGRAAVNTLAMLGDLAFHIPGNRPAKG
jgi:hypothetical protein